MAPFVISSAIRLPIYRPSIHQQSIQTTSLLKLLDRFHQTSNEVFRVCPKVAEAAMARVCVFSLTDVNDSELLLSSCVRLCHLASFLFFSQIDLLPFSLSHRLTSIYCFSHRLICIFLFFSQIDLHLFVFLRVACICFLTD